MRFVEKGFEALRGLLAVVQDLQLATDSRTRRSAEDGLAALEEQQEWIAGATGAATIAHPVGTGPHSEDAFLEHDQRYRTGSEAYRVGADVVSAGLQARVEHVLRCAEPVEIRVELISMLQALGLGEDVRRAAESAVLLEVAKLVGSGIGGIVALRDKLKREAAEDDNLLDSQSEDLAHRGMGVDGAAEILVDLLEGDARALLLLEERRRIVEWLSTYVEGIAECGSCGGSGMCELCGGRGFVVVEKVEDDAVPL